MTQLDTTPEAVHRAPAARSPAGGRRPGRAAEQLLGPVAVLIILGLWQLCASTGVVDSTITSDPWKILQAARLFYTSPGALGDLWASAKEIFWGLLLAVVLGILAGSVAGTVRRVRLVVNPLVTLVYAIPTIALAPLFVVWFGIGIRSKIAVVFVLAVFPVFISTEAGIRNAERDLIDVARAFRASRAFIVRKIILPSAVPSIIAGIRLAIAAGLIGMVVGEIIASTSGIGYVIEGASNTLNTSLLFVGVFTISVAALLLRGLLRLVERRLERWRPA